MRRSRLLTYLTLLTVALVTASCNRNVIYHHYEPTAIEGWDRTDTLTFSVATAKERAVVQRDVELRITDGYPYRQFSLIVEQATLPTGLHRTDTVNCQLVNAEGKIQGQGLTLYQYHFHLPDISLNEGDSLCFRIHHNMRREEMPGVSDVGLRLTMY